MRRLLDPDDEPAKTQLLLPSLGSGKNFTLKV